MERKNHRPITILVENDIADKVDWLRSNYGIPRSAIYSKCAELYITTIRDGIEIPNTCRISGVEDNV